MLEHSEKYAKWFIDVCVQCNGVRGYRQTVKKGEGGPEGSASQSVQEALGFFFSVSQCLGSRTVLVPVHRLLWLTVWNRARLWREASSRLHREVCCVAASCLCAHTSKSERVGEREGGKIVNQAEDVQMVVGLIKTAVEKKCWRQQVKRGVLSKGFRHWKPQQHKQKSGWPHWNWGGTDSICVPGEARLVYVFVFANLWVFPNPTAPADKGSCVRVCGRKQMAVVCVCPCPIVLACNARTLALKSERFAGVARRARRLFEIIRQLPALPGFWSSLSSSFSSSSALLCQD